eukprot:5708245-Amphidinium_carterae.1
MAHKDKKSAPAKAAPDELNNASVALATSSASAPTFGALALKNGDDNMRDDPIEEEEVLDDDVDDRKRMRSTFVTDATFKNFEERLFTHLGSFRDEVKASVSSLNKRVESLELNQVTAETVRNIVRDASPAAAREHGFVSEARVKELISEITPPPSRPTSPRVPAAQSSADDPLDSLVVGTFPLGSRSTDLIRFMQTKISELDEEVRQLVTKVFCTTIETRTVVLQCRDHHSMWAVRRAIYSHG